MIDGLGRRAKVGGVLAIGLAIAGCGRVQGSRESPCDMTPEGSVWLTVARIAEAEAKFQKQHGRYGELSQLTDLMDGLPASVTAGRMGTYRLRIDLRGNGYVLHADPGMPPIRAGLPSFYADQSGLLTCERSGKPATAASEPM